MIRIFTSEEGFSPENIVEDNKENGMIRIFTSEEGFSPENIVEDNEAFFLTYFKMYRMGEDEIEAIKKLTVLK